MTGYFSSSNRKTRTKVRKRVKANTFLSIVRKIPLFFLLLILIPVLINASQPDSFTTYIGKIKGRLYISDYYSFDSNDYNFHVLTSRIDLSKHEEDSPGYFFNFDGKVRKQITNGDLRSDVPKFEVSELWLGYKFPGKKLKIIGGRQYIPELYNTYIDGVNASYLVYDELGIGIFGGTAPDKESNAFSSDFHSLGGYIFLDNMNHKIQVGYENLSYNGKTDREYISLKAFSKLSNKTRLNVISSASRNQITDNIEIESANITVIHSYTNKLRFNIYYSYYNTIKYYESVKYYSEFSDTDDSFLLDDNSQTRIGLRVDYKLMKNLKVYVSGAYQKRASDDKDALRATTGFRRYDLYGFDISGRYTHIDNFTSSSDEFNLEVFRHFADKFDVSVYASREEEKLDMENSYTAGNLTYGASIYWPINKNFYLTAFAEHYDEDDYSNSSIFSQLGYKF